MSSKQTTSYPLTWPGGWKRTHPHFRQRANFSKNKQQVSVAEGTRRVLDELRRFGVPDYQVILSTNIQVRLDGLPYSNQKEPQDPLDRAFLGFTALPEPEKEREQES